MKNLVSIGFASPGEDSQQTGISVVLYAGGDREDGFILDWITTNIEELESQSEIVDILRMWHDKAVDKMGADFIIEDELQTFIYNDLPQVN